MELPKALIIFDVETTGIDPLIYNICQIGALKLTKNLTIKKNTFNSLIKPLSPRRIRKAMALHGIPEEKLRNAPELPTVLEKLEAWVEKPMDYWFSSWGNFDIEFLQHEYRKLNRKYPFSYRTFELKSACLIMMLLKFGQIEYHGLNSMRKKLKLPEFKRHDALSDAMESTKVFLQLVEELKQTPDMKDSIKKILNGLGEKQEKEEKYQGHFMRRKVKIDRYQKQILEMSKNKENFKLEEMDERFNNVIAQMSRKDYIKLYKQVVGEDDLLEWHKKEVGLQ